MRTDWRRDEEQEALVRSRERRARTPASSPAYVMAQMGHTSAALALEVYAKKMELKRDTGEPMGALLRGARWTDAAEFDGARIGRP